MLKLCGGCGKPGCGNFVTVRLKFEIYPAFSVIYVEMVRSIVADGA